MKRTSTVVKHIHKALSKIAQEMDYDRPFVHGNIIRWDGPFEWAILLTGGTCMWSNELGQYAEFFKCEKPLIKVIEKATKAGFTVECETAHALGVWK